jgi:flavin reductase
MAFRVAGAWTMNEHGEQSRSAVEHAELPVAADYKRAMRQLAGTVTIVTTQHDGRRAGMTATAVCSLSTDPPSLLACVNRSASSHGLIKAGRVLAVNILCTEHASLAREFSGTVPPHERFRSATWTSLKTGAPVLADAAAVFDCEVTDAVETGTHSIFICRVVDLKVSETREPLLYTKGSFARLLPLDVSMPSIG